MRRSALAALGVVALLSGCAYSLVSDGRMREEPFAEIVTRTAEVHGDPHPGVIDVRVIQPDAVPDVLRAAIASDWQPGELARYQEGLVSVGLWPPERDFVEEFLRVGREEVAGLYDSEQRTLFVVEGVSPPFSVRMLSLLLRRDLLHEAALTHEVVHLLQHRARPGLFEEMRRKGQDDVVSALQTAIEGDASYYGIVAMMPGEPSSAAALVPDPEQLRVSLERDVEERSSGALAESPALIRLTLTFPYARGYALSHAEGSELLAAPPVSTEQVLHAERRRADFWAVDLSAADAQLPAGCERVTENTAGELGVSVLLRDLGAESVASSVAEGWDGDRYLALRCGERRALLWWTAWDSVADAEEFEHAYAGIAHAVRARAELGSTPRVWRDEAVAVVATDGLDGLRAALPALARSSRVASLSDLRAHLAPPGR